MALPSAPVGLPSLPVDVTHNGEGTHGKLRAQDERRLAAVHARALAAAAGASAGEILTTVLFYPVELVKSRLQATVQGGAGAGGYAYRGLAHGLACVAREEGVRGLFAGLGSVALRALAAEVATVYFGDFLLGWYRCASGRGDLAVAVPLRTLGGWASISLTLPLETVATRVTCARPPISAGAAARELWQQGGVAAFWTGLPVSLLLCLNPALMLSAVDWLRRLLFACLLRLRGQQPEDGREVMSWAQALAVGAAAKLLTMSAVYPLVRGKVLLQARQDAGAGIFQVLRMVAKQEGFLCLYKGLGAQLSKSLLSASLKYAVKERTERRWQQVLLSGACVRT